MAKSHRPPSLLAIDDAALRGVGLSQQQASYLRAIAAAAVEASYR